MVMSSFELTPSRAEKMSKIVGRRTGDLGELSSNLDVPGVNHHLERELESVELTDPLVKLGTL